MIFCVELMEGVDLVLCGGIRILLLVGVPWLVLVEYGGWFLFLWFYIFSFLVCRIGHRGAVVGLRVVF
jgi:hypothetical protein